MYSYIPESAVWQIWRFPRRFLSYSYTNVPYAYLIKFILVILVGIRDVQ